MISIFDVTIEEGNSKYTDNNTYVNTNHVHQACGLENEWEMRGYVEKTEKLDKLRQFRQRQISFYGSLADLYNHTRETRLNAGTHSESSDVRQNSMRVQKYKLLVKMYS